MTSQLPSKKQHEVLNFIAGFIEQNSYGPSYREIAKALEYKSVSTVAAHVDGLMKKGYLEKPDEYSARSLRLKTPSTKFDKDVALDYLARCESSFREAGDEASVETIKKARQLLDQSAS